MEQLSIGGIMNFPPVFIKNENSPLQTEQYSFGVSFTQGLLGFHEFTHFILMDFPKPAYAPLKLMISTQEPSLRLAILHASELNDSIYALHVGEEVTKEFGWKEGDLEVFVVVTFNMKDQKLSLTANLKAPIIICKGTLDGVQHILSSNDQSLTYPLKHLSKIIGGRR